MPLIDELSSVWQRIDAVEKQLIALHRVDKVSRRLATIPGVGPITAMAIASMVGQQISKMTVFKASFRRQTHHDHLASYA